MLDGEKCRERDKVNDNFKKSVLSSCGRELPLNNSVFPSQKKMEEGYQKLLPKVSE